ncbi:Lipopolysaccharide-induced tumor necrosis factor-alpha factor-like protein [Aphelenchoides bicaudatus]|nr:Lipopolysaccharide-induced tumor necrosis factor-alpha factor-like protein [Aphelenchoides bicaudatus]
MDQRPKSNRFDGANNKFDNTHVFIAQPAVNPNAMPDIYELGFPSQSANTPLAQSFLPTSNVPPPPSYSQSVNVPTTQTLVQNAPVQTSNVHVVINLQLGPFPASIQCPFCKFHIITKATHKAGLLAWIICCVLAFFGCWPCCICPFFLTSCKDTVHTCPNCGVFISRYRRI